MYIVGESPHCRQHFFALNIVDMLMSSTFHKLLKIVRDKDTLLCLIVLSCHKNFTVIRWWCYFSSVGVDMVSLIQENLTN